MNSINQSAPKWATLSKSMKNKKVPKDEKRGEDIFYEMIM